MIELARHPTTISAASFATVDVCSEPQGSIAIKFETQAEGVH
jgi:hypothetical protein